MQHRFQVGDRVIVIDAAVAGVPVGTVGTVVRAFARVPEICDLQFDGYRGVRAVLTRALAPVPTSDTPPPTSA